MKSFTVYVKTDQGYWGIGSTLEEAMKNAKVKRGHQCYIEIWDQPRSNIVWDAKISNHRTVDGSGLNCVSITSKPFKR